MTPDVNVLVSASRADHEHHEVAAGWLWRLLNSPDPGARLTLLPMVVTGFARVVSSPRIFDDPTPLDEALGFIEDLLASPRAAMAELGQEWAAFAALCTAHNLVGNAISDAWIAAAARYHRETVVTLDRGFRRLLAPSEVLLLKSEPGS